MIIKEDLKNLLFVNILKNTKINLILTSFILLPNSINQTIFCSIVVFINEKKDKLTRLRGEIN